jgi:hypothetical protein
MPRKPFIHTADDFELTVDEYGLPHFVDMRYLTSFGRRHGGNLAAFGLVVLSQFLALLIALAVGSIAKHVQLGNYALACALLTPLSVAVTTIFIVVFLYYRLRMALTMIAVGLTILVIIIGGFLVLF